jgi:hypothetical protein
MLSGLFSISSKFRKDPPLHAAKTDKTMKNVTVLCFRNFRKMYYTVKTLKISSKWYFSAFQCQLQKFGILQSGIEEDCAKQGFSPQERGL